MTSSWFDLDLTSKTLNPFSLRFNEQSGFENHVIQRFFGCRKLNTRNNWYTYFFKSSTKHMDESLATSTIAYKDSRCVLD